MSDNIQATYQLTAKYPWQLTVTQNGLDYGSRGATPFEAIKEMCALIHRAEKPSSPLDFSHDTPPGPEVGHD